MNTLKNALMSILTLIYLIYSTSIGVISFVIGLVLTPIAVGLAAGCVLGYKHLEDRVELIKEKQQ